MKRLIALVTAIILVIPTFLVSATTQNQSTDDKPQGDGSYSAKHEVVYATLDATGNQESMYIVNNFNIEKPGKIIDYGAYTSVQNLTNLYELKKDGNKVEFIADEDQFYYEGTLENKQLPWNIDVNYQLNGKDIGASELVGQDGHVTIHIKTEANKKSGREYYNNYLLQITVPLSTDHFSNIEAPAGTIATAGKDKQVTFTVMPEKDGNFTVEADAKQFEMDGIQINAMPSSMSIDSPDTGEMTSDMKSLSDATSEVNNGVGELKNGISKLANGIQDLQSGSKDYQNGVKQLSERSSEIIDGSKQIQTALNKINESLSRQTGNMNSGKLRELQNGLYKIADGLKQTEDGLNELNTNYQQAYQALDGAINEIPEHQITKTQIEKLYQSGADQKVIDQLVETYKSARKAKGTYQKVQQAFTAVPSTLDSVTGSLSEMRKNLRTMADELGKSLEQMNMAKSIQQLQDGLGQLSSNYDSFHSGLVKYTDGVSELAHSYSDLHGGMTQLANGAHDLEDGAQELHNGTAELAQSTSDLPEEMQNEIDQMINEFDKSDFEPTSFVSPKNDKVETVQFVIKTENIKPDEEETKVPKTKENKSFWDKLINLFN